MKRHTQMDLTCVIPASISQECQSKSKHDSSKPQRFILSQCRSPKSRTPWVMLFLKVLREGSLSFPASPCLLLTLSSVFKFPSLNKNTSHWICHQMDYEFFFSYLHLSRPYFQIRPLSHLGTKLRLQNISIGEKHRK